MFSHAFKLLSQRTFEIRQWEFWKLLCSNCRNKPFYKVGGLQPTACCLKSRMSQLSVISRELVQTKVPHILLTIALGLIRKYPKPVQSSPVKMLQLGPGQNLLTMEGALLLHSPDNHSPDHDTGRPVTIVPAGRTGNCYIWPVMGGEGGSRGVRGANYCDCDHHCNIH